MQISTSRAFLSGFFSGKNEPLSEEVDGNGRRIVLVMNALEHDKCAKKFAYLKKAIIFARNQHKIKENSMKKLLVILAVAGAMTACNNSTEPSGGADSTVKAAMDTAKAMVDTAAKKADSTVKAVADTAKAKINAAVDSAKAKIKK